MSEDLINQITLDCLINREIYSKMQNTNNIKNNVNKKDKKFYRKRILNLTKDLLLKKNIPYDEINPDIKNSFDNFMKTCIHYFKIVDTNDIIQEQYKELNTLTEAIEPSENNNLNIEETDNKSSTINEKDNRLFMRSIKIKNGLEDFVKRKSTKKADEIILPKIKEINLEDPILRIKGIIPNPKKENINIH